MLGERQEVGSRVEHGEGKAERRNRMRWEVCDRLCKMENTGGFDQGVTYLILWLCVDRARGTTPFPPLLPDSQALGLPTSTR